jgi:hypothetical protein
VVASGALWWLHPYDPKNFPDDEKALENIFLGLERQLTDTGVFGCMDWGDMHSRWDKKQWDGYRYCLNNETTGDATTISPWMQYVRTAQRRYFKFNERRTCHLMDVDTCHFSVNQPPHVDGMLPDNDVNIVGLQHRHSDQHWSGSTVMHHTCYDDVLLYYYLTGRARPLEILKEAAATMKTCVPTGHFSDQRGVDVPFRLMGDLYWHFGDFDFWRMAVEVHDRLITYSFPDNRGEYGYVRYALFSGDRRYGLEWATHRMIQGNSLDVKIDPGLALDAAKFASYPETVLLAALRYQITGDKRVLAQVVKACKVGGDLAYCVTGPLLKNFPDDGAKNNPPGHGWPQMSAFKYAFGMEALVRADLLRERQYKPALRTNGKGGGRWSDAAAFTETRRPDADTPVIVEKGDTLEYDGKEEKPVVGGITVSPGATLAFTPGQRSLVVRGNILVQDGLIRLLPGNALKIDCDLYSGQYGITFEKGRLEMQGTSPQKRDCYLGPFTADGLHDTYLKLDKAGQDLGYGFIRNACVSQCNFEVRTGGLEVSGTSLNRLNFSVWWLYKQPLLFNEDEITSCSFNLFQVCDLAFNKNVVSGTFFSVHPNGSGTVVTRFQKNVFADGCGFDIVSTDKGIEFSGNTYQKSRVGIRANGVLFKEEPFSGNETAIGVGGPVTLSLESCVFGKDAPNSKADIDAGSAKVRLKNCRFTGEPKIIVSGEGGVRSEDHNGQAGQTKSWGKPLLPLPQPEVKEIKN